MVSASLDNDDATFDTAHTQELHRTRPRRHARLMSMAPTTDHSASYVGVAIACAGNILISLAL